MNGLQLMALAGAYMAFLFVFAWTTERFAVGRQARLRPLVYGLSLAVYCTSWTYFGAVGTAARTGWNYLPIYIGPALALTIGFPIWRRIATAAKRENTGSIADFLSARYGKSPALGALVAAVAIVGALPYIALQLRSLTMAAGMLSGGAFTPGPATVFLFAAVLAGFAMLFGARRPGLTEHNPGLIRAIALESVVKLAALISVALFALDLMARLPRGGLELAPHLAEPPRFDLPFLTQILLAGSAIFCLPRQFLTGFVEIEDLRDMGAARLILPAYLLLTCLAVVPLASAGLRLGGANPDMFVLALPFAGGHKLLTDFVFLGGVSAATAMVVVETVALSGMASNQFILPWLTRRWMGRAKHRERDLAPLITGVRRAAIAAILAVASLYTLALRSQGDLASIGLSSFAAAAQLGPALLAAVFWKRAHARGALAGVASGAACWALLLALPQLLGATHPYSLAISDAMRALLHLDVLTGASLLSLGLNTAVFVLVSLRAQPAAVDHVQARAFVSPGGGTGDAAVALGDEAERLQQVVARFLGETGAQRGFAQVQRELGRAPNASGPVDAALALAAERMLAGAIGASSAREVIAQVLAGDARRPNDVVRILDNAAQAVQFNRELLQSTLDNLSQGVSVVDKNLRLVAWNARYVEMFDLPPDFVHVGKPIADVIRYNALRGECGPGEVEAHVERRLDHLRRRRPHIYERRRPGGDIIRSNGAPMPNGGYLTSYTDITELRTALDARAEANERLEARVVERTEALAAAKAQAEAATASKTRFLAAASHDLLQPLHAARLFLAALEADLKGQPSVKGLADAADQSIDAAHKLLRALLNLSKLEAGGVKPSLSDFPIASLFAELEREFAPQAQAKGLRLDFVATDAMLRSDQDLIRSVLQNLIGNAVRYTSEGRVLVGCRRSGEGWRLEVWDTGPGIAAEAQERVFGEFTRLGGAADEGAGLGLAIVRKIAELLGETVQLRSTVGRGSVFAFSVAKGEIAPSAAAPAGPRAAVPRGLRVLCIDNEPTILRGMRAVLERLGAEVTTASGRDAALACEGRFDLILADYHLDHGDGLGLHEALGSRTDRFVIVTADTSEALVRDAASAGVELVRKPIRPEVLRGLLAGRRTAAMEAAQ